MIRFESEVAPIVPMRLKVEINCREHFNVLGLTTKELNVRNQWYSGKCNTTIYTLDELLGTKLRALYQRRKGRDLYDIYKALIMGDVNADNVLLCYHKYMSFVVDRIPSQKEYLKNIEQKLLDDEFLGDTKLLLRQEEQYDPQKAYEIIKTSLLARL